MRLPSFESISEEFKLGSKEFGCILLGEEAIPTTGNQAHETVIRHPVIFKSKDPSFWNGGFDLNHTKPMIRGLHDLRVSNCVRVLESPRLAREEPIQSFQERGLLLVSTSKFSPM
jgi:hypothetical protein